MEDCSLITKFDADTRSLSLHNVCSACVEQVHNICPLDIGTRWAFVNRFERFGLFLIECHHVITRIFCLYLIFPFCVYYEIVLSNDTILSSIILREYFVAEYFLFCDILCYRLVER